MTMNNQRSATIELHIDELTLHGFPQLDRDQLDAAVRMELTRLLTAARRARRSFARQSK